MLIVSIIAAALSVIAIIVSIYAVKQSKKDSFQAIASLITSQKNFYLEMYAKFIETYDSDENSKYIIDEAASNYCNTLENACALYIEGGIDRKLFELVFKDEIATVPEMKGVASFLIEDDLSSTNDTYINIVKVNNLFEKNRGKKCQH